MTLRSDRVRPADRIALVEVASGTAFAAAPDPSLVLSSSPFAWRGIVVEWHRLAPQELPEHYVRGHGLAVNIGAQSVPFGWKDGDRRIDGVIHPGEFHLLTNGEYNTPRWSRVFDEITLVVDPGFVAAAARDGIPAASVEFATQRSRCDTTISNYAERFRNELGVGSLNGPLYAETLTIGLTLHLLSSYSIAKPRIPFPRGKLTSSQLRDVIDLIMGCLSNDVSLLAMAEIARVSPFHFARAFRRTVGVTPHRFVLRQRIQRSLTLIKGSTLPLSRVAVDCGFYDQAHFTHAFRKLVGLTPAEYARQTRPRSTVAQAFTRPGDLVASDSANRFGKHERGSSG